VGVRIIDLSFEFAGRYATRILADQGIEVIEVRLPSDAAMRTHGPNGELIEHHFTRNKISVELDYTSSTGKHELLELMATSDFVVHTFRNDEAVSLGLSPLDEDFIRAGATLVSITPYGQKGSEGRRRSTEKTLLADSGATLITGRSSREPLSINLPIASVLGGIYGAIAMLAVSIGESSPPAHIDVALRDLVPPNLEKTLPFYTYLSAVPYRQAANGHMSVAVGAGTFAAKDGWFHCFAGNKPLSTIAELVGRSDLVDVPMWSDPKLRNDHSDEIEAAIREGVAKFTIAELTKRAAELALPSGEVADIALVMANPQFQYRKALTRDENGKLNIEEPYQFEKGGGNHETMRSVSIESLLASPTTRQRDGSKRAAPYDRQPLSGIRVLDLTHAYAGPTATRILAELGAEVIKVESVHHIDIVPRGLLPVDNDPSGDWWEKSGWFAERNALKKGLTLDMSSEVGRDLFRKLIPDAQVIASNFTPRVMRGWGLDPTALLQARPDLVVLNMSGFGAAGPDAERPALAGLMEAISGLTSMTRYFDDDVPEGLGFAFCDAIAGLFGALSILIGLHHRALTGEGDAIDLAATTAPLPFLVYQLNSYVTTGTMPSVTWDPFTEGSHRLVQSVGEGELRERWIMAEIPPGREKDFAECVRENDPQRAATFATSDLPIAELMVRLTDGGFVAAPLSDGEDLWLDPSLHERMNFAWYEREGVGLRPYGRLISILADDNPIGGDLKAPPRLGQDNREILIGLLNVSEDEFEGLEEEHIIGTKPVTGLPRLWTIPLALDEVAAMGRCRLVPDAKEKLSKMQEIDDRSLIVSRGSQ
jgi:crotonobetainyl-CoA:carnitine CoA-transferase CaiB-like acyl-CoA transferase